MFLKSLFKKINNKKNKKIKKMNKKVKKKIKKNKKNKKLSIVLFYQKRINRITLKGKLKQNWSLTLIKWKKNKYNKKNKLMKKIRKK